MANLCPKKLKAAFYVECQSAAFHQMQEVEELPDTVLNKVPLGANQNIYDNGDTIISGRSRQAPSSFKTIPKNTVANKPLVNGTLSGRDCTDGTAFFDTRILDTSEGACEETACGFSFGQGYRTMGSFDRSYTYKSDVVCVKDLEQLPPARAKEYLQQMVEDFKEHGAISYARDIRNMALVNSAANGSVITANDLTLASGKFYAPPQSRITIHYLKEYREHMVRQGALKRNEMLIVSGPEQDWCDAYSTHMALRYTTGGIPTPANFTLNANHFDENEKRMRGQKFYECEGIRWIVDETPARGYFKPNGTTASGQVLYTFVDVEPWVDEVQEAGVMSVPNLDYGKEYAWCEGQKYRIVTLLEVINSKQFSRHNLNEPVDLQGRKSGVSHNFELAILDGHGIDCNEFNDKFRLLARRRYRWRNVRTEYGGFIAYLHARPCGYVLKVCDKDVVTPAEQPASVITENDCNETCGDCSTPSTAKGSLALTPCPGTRTLWNGTTRRLRLRVSRNNGSNGAVGVAYALTAGTAIAGTHYQDMTTPAGTLVWAAGDIADKFIEIDIIGGVNNSDIKFDVTLSTPTGGAILADCRTTTVYIEAHSPATAPCAGCTSPVPI